MREYDVVKHQPHPPGYILYVALGRLVNAWFDNPTATYVALAVVFSGLTTFVVYYLARAIYDRATALAAATLLSYVFLYTPLKRRTPHSLLVGAVPGALPILGGWTAAGGALTPIVKRTLA